MSLLTLQSVNFDYGRERVLADASVSIFAGMRYALVGANGAGKTTLMAALAGRLPLGGGTRQTTGSLTIGELAQETTLETTEAGERLLTSVRRRAFARELELEAQLTEVGRELEIADAARQEELLQRQGRLQAEFEGRDGYRLQHRLETALRGVGLPEECWDRPLSELSGGEGRRAGLATVLLAGGDLLLLDEPTNHLDLEACEWLESWLLDFQGAAVLVSHDRQFLDRVADKTILVEDARTTTYSGNYTFFERTWREQAKQALARWQRQQDHIRQTEEFIRRNLEGQKTKQAQARRKALAKEDRIARPAAAAENFRLRLEPARRSGGMILEAHGLSRAVGPRSLFTDLDLLVTRGERIGIIGPNGCGKSTLLHLLAGRDMPTAGDVKRGHNVDLGLYDQRLQTVSDHHTVMGEIAAVDPAATVGELRSFLAAFGFGEEMIDRSVGDLSGGERARLALLRLIKEGHNCLLLDEPTNHLDIRCRESLEAGLDEYDGTLIVVSHDRRFLDKLVDRLVVFAPAGVEGEEDEVRLFAGNYADWTRRRTEEKERQRDARRAEESAARPVAGAERAAPKQAGLSKNEKARRRKWLVDVEEDIAVLETEKEGLVQSMADADQTADERRRRGLRFQEIEEELVRKMEQWEQWVEELEGDVNE